MLEQDMLKHVKGIVSDNGPPFFSKSLQQWARSIGVELHNGALYHPEANGPAERLTGDVQKY